MYPPQVPFQQMVQVQKISQDFSEQKGATDWITQVEYQLFIE